MQVFTACSLIAAAQDPDSLPAYYGDKDQGTQSLRKNLGQVFDTDGDAVSDIDYYFENTPVGIYLRDKSEVSFTLAMADDDTATTDTLYRIDMEFSLGRSRSPEHTGEACGGLSNYYRGASAVEEVKAYGQVVYRSVWDSINVYFYRSLGGPRMALVVLPGGDPADIILKFNGQDSIRVDWQGALRLYVGQQWIRLEEAMAYQVDDNNELVPVTWQADYDYTDGNTYVQFEFSDFDDQKPLVFQIGYPPMMMGGGDPDNFCWSTYFGGSGNVILATCVDDDGGFYAAGYNSAGDFPATVGTTTNPGAGTFSGTIAKFNSAYQILWTTYYGGSDDDRFNDIAYSNYGDDLFGVGQSRSTDLPTPMVSGEYDDSSLNGTEDAFMCRLNSANGTLEWAAYLGGEGGDKANALVCDENGNQYLFGNATDGLDLEGWGSAELAAFAGGDADAFIMRFDNTQDLIWSTYIGGPYYESFAAGALDDEGNIFVIGTARSGFPQIDDCGSLVSAGPQGSDDCVLLKFDATGHVCWSTYAGGLENDFASSEGTVAIGNGRVYFAANTQSENFPTEEQDGAFWQPAHAGNGDGAMMCFDLSTLEPIWMTYVGGTERDEITGIGTDTWGNLYVTGHSKSADMPLVPLTDAYNQAYAGAGSIALYGDAFVGSYTYPEHNPTWLTMVGGGDTYQYEGDGAQSITVDGHDRLFIAGTSSSTGPPYPPHDPGNGAYFGGTVATGGSVISCFDLIEVPVSIPVLPVIPVASLSLTLNTDQSLLVAIATATGDRQVELMDAAGRMIGTFRFAAGQTNLSIPVGTLASGSYLVSVRSPHGLEMGRFVKP